MNNCKVQAVYMDGEQIIFEGEVMRDAGSPSMLVKGCDGNCYIIPIADNLKFISITPVQEGGSENDG